MKKILIVLFLMLSMTAFAQDVQRSGNNFTQSSSVKKADTKETKTQYTFTDNKGNVYPVFLSSTGKAYIKKVSKKTGKEYKQYMPEIGKQINPAAYQKEKK